MSLGLLIHSRKRFHNLVAHFTRGREAFRWKPVNWEKAIFTFRPSASVPGPSVEVAGTAVWDHNGSSGARLKAGSVRRECEVSLRRLKTDVIDLYQIHWPEPDEDIEEG